MNKDPSHETRFKPGVSGNPSGRSSEELIAMNEAAKISANLRLAALSCLQGKVDAGEDLLEYLDANILNLFKQSEDRAHGTPKQYVDSTSSDGSMTPTKIIRELVTPKEHKE
tara:strand:- start:1186 stop:1521 length:336 start_codon:yes stop_codon:yes gene_type:complete